MGNWSTTWTTFLNDAKKRTRSVSENFKEYQPLKWLEEARKPTNRCRSCGKYSEGEYCNTHKRLMAGNQTKLKQDERGTSRSFPKLPMKKTVEQTVITITTDSQTTDGEEPTRDEEKNPTTGEVTETVEVTEICAPSPTATANRTLTTQTPMPTSPIDCSTALSVRTNGQDPTTAPTRPSDNTPGLPEGCKVHGNGECLMGFKVGMDENKITENSQENNNSVRRSSRIRTAKRVEKMGGIEIL